MAHPVRYMEGVWRWRHECDASSALHGGSLALAERMWCTQCATWRESGVGGADVMHPVRYMEGVWRWRSECGASSALHGGSSALAERMWCIQCAIWREFGAGGTNVMHPVRYMEGIPRCGRECGASSALHGGNPALGARMWCTRLRIARGCAARGTTSAAAQPL